MLWGVIFVVAVVACLVAWAWLELNGSGGRRPHGDRRQEPPISGSGGDGWKSRP
jgi:hypothetical protein